MRQVIGHSDLYTIGKFTADTFILYHRTVQPLTAFPRLAKSPIGHQTAQTDLHFASEKQPAIADHLSVKYEFIHLKINSADMDNNTNFLRPSHIYVYCIYCSILAIYQSTICIPILLPTTTPRNNRDLI